MYIGHASPITTRNQLANTVQHLGACLGSTFIDAGIHPSCSTHNFTLPVQNGHCLEVACPLDHHSPEPTIFGKTVTQRTVEGSGWLTWVVAVYDVSKIEKRLDRAAVYGHRTKPGGKDIAWKQIGVLGTLEDKQLPYFIEWHSLDHPSIGGNAIAKIVKVEIFGDESCIEEWLESELRTAIGSDI